MRAAIWDGCGGGCCCAAVIVKPIASAAATPNFQLPIPKSRGDIIETLFIIYSLVSK
jgi:hypothetical protein